MHVSIVIPTFNRSRLLPATIRALTSQQSGDFTYEVIFVSNGSSDGTDRILKEAVARFPNKVRYYYIAPTGGPSAPRNLGIRTATGEVVIILDDDVLPDPDMVLKHAEFHNHHPAAHHVALGEVYVPPSLLDDPMSMFHVFPYEEVRKLERLSYLHFWTCNISMKRQFMLDAGMFDERFLAYEDILCGHQLATNGMHLHFLPCARGQHLHQIKPEGIPAKGLWYGRWLYAFVEQLPKPEVKVRFGILSTDIGAGLLIRRLANRLAFRTIDNPLTAFVLRLFGATGGKRSRISDFYYFLIFRRSLLAGYYEVKREARKRHQPALKSVNPQWADRGEHN